MSLKWVSARYQRISVLYLLIISLRKPKWHETGVDNADEKKMVMITMMMTMMMEMETTMTT